MPRKERKEKKRLDSKKPTYEELAEIIKKNAGIITAVAKAIGVDPKTIWLWKEKDERILQMFEQAREHVLDLAESKLVEAIGQGQPWAVCFLLKCQGKRRGWNERMEITGKDGGALEVKSFVDLVQKVEERLGGGGGTGGGGDAPGGKEASSA